MAFNREQDYIEVFGPTADGHRYTQNGARYKADGKLCKGSKENKPENHAKANKALADENADLKAQIDALKAAQASPVEGVDGVDTDDLGGGEDDLTENNNGGELAIVEVLESDIGNSKGSPYKTAESAQLTIKKGENLMVIRAKDGFYLRAAGK